MFSYLTLKQKPEWRERDVALRRAEKALKEPFRFITDERAEGSPGDAHDYFSNADYLWPNPDPESTQDYISRDGRTNPANFEAHRHALRQMRRTVVYLAAGYHLTEDARYAARAADYLRGFFLDEATFMRPEVPYAQYITGEGFRKGTGIIDTLHLIDVPLAVRHLEKSPHFPPELAAGLREWFRRYFGWMLSSQDGIEEMLTENNHAICYFLQAAVWARFTENPRLLDFCRENFIRCCLPQMAEDGSFPQELKRSKPYGYSIFTLDNFVNLAWFISDDTQDFMRYKDARGCGVERGIDYLLPYLKDKSSRPYPPDVEHDDGWPARMPFMLLAASVFGRDDLAALYYSLPRESEDMEVLRNTASREVLLWLLPC